MTDRYSLWQSVEIDGDAGVGATGLVAAMAVRNDADTGRERSSVVVKYSTSFGIATDSTAGLRSTSTAGFLRKTGVGIGIG